MTDIVERLRARAEQEHEMLGDIHLPLLEAAAEIERLRAALEALLDDVDGQLVTLRVREQARAALAQGGER